MGDDQLDTLVSALNLAENLHQLGAYEQARRMNEETLHRAERVLGTSHPATLVLGSNLVDNLRQLGQQELARQREENALKHGRNDA